MPKRLNNSDTVIAHLSELFREHGFEGTSMSQITKATGLGKGSLYHAFPGGKEEMAATVLAEIDTWFDEHVFQPLSDTNTPPLTTLLSMLDACETYFHRGGRVCLVGTFALSDTRDRFPDAVNKYFLRWQKAITTALQRTNLSKSAATELAEEILARIQGGLTLARAFNEPSYFEREIDRLRLRIKKAC